MDKQHMALYRGTEHFPEVVYKIFEGRTACDRRRWKPPSLIVFRKLAGTVPYEFLLLPALLGMVGKETAFKACRRSRLQQFRAHSIA